MVRSCRGIGALLMDQSCFAGVGNIFRAEILHVAGVHPSVSGKDLTREQSARDHATVGETVDAKGTI